MLRASVGHPLRRVAVIKPCCIGDCVMALPAVSAIHAAFPDAEVELFVGEHSRAVFEIGSPFASIRVIPERQEFRSTVRLARRFRDGKYERIVILDRSRAIRLAALRSGANVVAATFDASEQRHESEVYLDVVRSLGISAPPILPCLAPHESSVAAARSLLTGVRWPFIAIHPGGAQNPGSAMPAKRWPTNRWIDVTRRMIGAGYDVVLTGGPGDRSLADTIATSCEVPNDRVMAGKIDLATSAAVAAQSALLIGGDTGMSHIAAAVGTPTVAIFGPTNPRRYRPLGPHVRVVAPPEAWSQGDLDLRKPSQRTATVDISNVTADDVYTAAQSLLRSASI
jgi:heptosyltransferase-2/heptosyltransferase-3